MLLKFIDVDCPRTLCFIYKAILDSLYPVCCHSSHLPRLCSTLLHGEKKLKTSLMNINEKKCSRKPQQPGLFTALSLTRKTGQSTAARCLAYPISCRSERCISISWLGVRRCAQLLSNQITPNHVFESGLCHENQNPDFEHVAVI